MVASEVKALSLESRESAEKITGMITNLQKKTRTAAEGVSSATNAVKEGNLLLSDTLKIFSRMAGSVEEISTHIEQVASMNEEQAAAVEEIASSMHEVSSMLKDTAGEAAESAAATRDTSSSLHELGDIVQTVSLISGEISAYISRLSGKP